MDLAFAAQALALAWLAADPPGGQAPLLPGVHEVPAEIDAQIDTLALASLGVQIDTLSYVQEEYLDSWRQGS